MKTLLIAMAIMLFLYLGFFNKKKPPSEYSELIPSSPVEAINRAFDVHAKATLQNMRMILEAYRAENGTYPQVQYDNLGELKMVLGNYFTPNISTDSSTSGALTGYRSDAYKYSISAVGSPDNYYHLTSNGTFSGPDSSPSINF